MTICIAIATFFLALGITLYPIISTRYNQQHQSEIHTTYEEQIAQADTTAIDTAREQAKAYNASICPGVRDVEAFSHEAIMSAAEDYEGLLNIGGNKIMGYVEVPTLGIQLPIYHGTEDATLEKGIGHLLGSSLPVGGTDTHTVLTAHSGMASQRMFSDLDQLQVGDIFFLDVLGEELAYEVDQIKTVLPHDTTYLGIIEGEDHATLVTCTPFAVNTHRLLVRGVRTTYEKPQLAEEETLPAETEPMRSTWEQEYMEGIYTAIGVVIIIAAIAFAWWLFQRYSHADAA